MASHESFPSSGLWPPFARNAGGEGKNYIFPFPPRSGERVPEGRVRGYSLFAIRYSLPLIPRTPPVGQIWPMFSQARAAVPLHAAQIERGGPNGSGSPGRGDLRHTLTAEFWFRPFLTAERMAARLLSPSRAGACQGPSACLRASGRAAFSSE